MSNAEDAKQNSNKIIKTAFLMSLIWLITTGDIIEPNKKKGEKQIVLDIEKKLSACVRPIYRDSKRETGIVKFYRIQILQGSFPKKKAK